MIRTYGFVVVLAGAVALSLAACKPNTPGNTSAANGVASATGTDAAAEKRKRYTEAYNELIDPEMGLPGFVSGYRELDIPHADPASAIHFPVFANINLQLTQLKDARKLPGDANTAPADAAVDALIAKLEPLMVQSRALEPYYTTRAYRDDALAKGKAADAPLVSAIDAVRAALSRLDAALRDRERGLAAGRIAALRKGGFTAEADMIDMMQKGDRFAQAVIANEVATADRLLPELSAAATALAAATPKGPNATIDKTHFSMIANDGNAMVGAWRDYKASKSDTDRQRVITSYNSAVSTASLVAMPVP